MASISTGNILSAADARLEQGAPARTSRFTLLLRELRRQLDVAGTNDVKILPEHRRRWRSQEAYPPTSNSRTSRALCELDQPQRLPTILHSDWKTRTITMPACAQHVWRSALPSEAAVVSYLSAGVRRTRNSSSACLTTDAAGKASDPPPRRTPPAFWRPAMPGTYPPDMEWEYPRYHSTRLTTRPGVYKRFWDGTAKAPWIYTAGRQRGTFVTTYRNDKARALATETKFIQGPRTRRHHVAGNSAATAKTSTDSLLHKKISDGLKP